MSKYEKSLECIPQTPINNILVEGEAIIWKTKPKKSAFIINKILVMLPFALIWLCIDMSFIIIFLQNAEDSQFIWFLIPFFAIHLMPVWIWLGNVLTANKKWKNTEYIVTDKRIIIQSGFIGLDYQTIYYKDITNVSLNVGFVDKLLHVGDISLDLKKGGKQLLLDIENPYELYPRFQKVIMDIQTDIEYPNGLRPDENPGYNTKYTGKI